MRRPKVFKQAPKKNNLTNRDCLRFKQIRLIEDKTNHGLVTPGKALYIAEDAGLDLVCINPNSNPPVCKIIDYAKFNFDQQKIKKQQKKQQKMTQLKEMDFRPSIDQHDFETKCRKIKDFINKGSKVKVVVKTKGRERALFDYKSFFDRVLEALDNVKFDSSISRTHGRFSCIITAE